MKKIILLALIATSVFAQERKKDKSKVIKEDTIYFKVIKDEKYTKYYTLDTFVRGFIFKRIVRIEKDYFTNEIHIAVSKEEFNKLNERCFSVSSFNGTEINDTIFNYKNYNMIHFARYNPKKRFKTKVFIDK